MRETEPDIELGDEEIIRIVLQGDKDAFRGLLLRHQSIVFSMIMRQIADRTLASELTQETFIKAFTHLASFRAESSFATWLVRIALNVTNNHLKSKAFRVSKTSMPVADHMLTSTPESEQSKRWNEHRLQRLREEILRLPQKLREVLSLTGLDGKTYEETAQILAIPLGTVRSRLNTARNLLRETLREAEEV